MHSKKNLKCMQETELIAIPVSVELSNHSSLPSLELLNRVITTAVTKKYTFRKYFRKCTYLYFTTKH